MPVRHSLVLTATVSVAVLSLAGCQQKEVAAVSVTPGGIVTISTTSAVSYDLSGGNLTVIKPDPAQLLAAAKHGTHAYVGPGVAKPVFTLIRVGKRQLVLTVSQKLDSIALLNKHEDAFDPATLSLDVEPTTGAKPDPADPFGLKGPRTEKVTTDGDDGEDSGSDVADDSQKLSVTHVGHRWGFSIAESAKDFAQERRAYASTAASARKAGLPVNAITVEFHVKLPGTIVSTNGKRLGGGVVSWSLLNPTAAKLFLTTRD